MPATRHAPHPSRGVAHAPAAEAEAVAVADADADAKAGAGAGAGVVVVVDAKAGAEAEVDAATVPALGHVAASVSVRVPVSPQAVAVAPGVSGALARWWRGRERMPGSLSGVAVLGTVFIPFALGHYLSWLLRSVNAMLAPRLLADAAVTPGQLGLLTSTYFLAFALAQLPVGIALDRYGPRRVQAVLLPLAALGTLAFAGGASFTQLAIARGLMGLGLAACFMAAIKAITTWIAPHKAPSVQGYLIAAGGLGAATSTLPVRLALHYMNWQTMMAWLAAACLLVALLIVLLAPTPPAAKPRPFSLGAMREVLRHPVLRATTALVLLPHAVFFGVQGLWISRWLADVPRYGEQGVAWLLYLGMAAVIFGSIATGMLVEWTARRGWRALDVAAAGIALFMLVQCGFVAGWRPAWQLLPVLFMLVGCVTGIEYTIVSQSMPPELTGRASTCLNLLIFVAAFVVQAGFGQLVGLWQVSPQGHYPAAAYQCAFALLLLIQLPGLCRYLLGRIR